MKACRIEGHEGSPVRLPLDRHCHAVPGSSYGLRGDGPSAPRLGFHRCPNRPDEAQEFAPDGRHDLLFTFPPRRQGAIARVQPVLRFPGDRFHLFTDGLLTLEERPPPGRPVSVRPGRFNHDAPQVRIAGLGNAAAADPVAESSG